MSVNTLNEKTKGIISLVILAVIYGGTGAIVRYLSAYFTDFQQIYLRTFLALLLGFVIFRKKINFAKLKIISSSELILLIVRSVGMFLFAIPLWVMAVSRTTLANVAFIDSLPLTATLSFLFLKENLE